MYKLGKQMMEQNIRYIQHTNIQRYINKAKLDDANSSAGKEFQSLTVIGNKEK